MSTKRAGSKPDVHASTRVAETHETAGGSQPPADRTTFSEPPVSGMRSQRQYGRWSVVEEFVREGYSYRVLRRPATESGEPPRLTKREEEVVACATDGSTNKSIAYALGLSPSTVGVLLSRAAAKLGARSRSELIDAYSSLKSHLRRNE